MVDISRWWTGGLILVSKVLSATVVLTSFSLLIYLLTHNFRSAVARAFCALLAFVLIVYTGDVALYEAQQASALRWLTFQWIGIALVPAAYLDFSDALLRTTHLRTRWRRIVVPASYAVSAVLLGLAVFSDWIVHDGVFHPEASHLAPGRFFWLFALYFAVTVLWGAANIQRTRRRCLTRASRRRMTYLGLAFFAPALGVFPYLVLTTMPSSLPANGFRLLLIAGNVGVLLMIVLMAYSVAYFGALTPDRVVRHSLIHYLLRGPVVGAAVIFTMLAVPKVQQILGLPRDTVLIFAVVGVVVLMQLLINIAKPFIDRAIYRQDREEITWIQTLDRRLLTSADLAAFLENVLAALCDLLQVRTAFVAIQAGGDRRLEAQCGDRASVQQFLESRDLAALVPSADEPPDGCPFLPGEHFWLVPLHADAGEMRFGLLGVEARRAEPDLVAEERETAELLIARAREALEDRYLQQGVFDTLRRILPDIQRLHRWQDATRYAGALPAQESVDSPIHAPQFQSWVRDALNDYWGGARLTESPLLELNVVRDLVRGQSSSPAHALRAVLVQAIESLRPAGERKMAAGEWLLYNILEMKFIRGLKVREIAMRLAMSESDLYRKQRVAIAEVARSLAVLERQRNGPPGAF